MEWISIQDKKPKIYEDVLLYTTHNIIVIGDYLGHNTYSAPGKYHVLGQCIPTHWMPLPKEPSPVS